MATAMTMTMTTTMAHAVRRGDRGEARAMRSHGMSMMTTRRGARGAKARANDDAEEAEQEDKFLGRTGKRTGKEVSKYAEKEAETLKAGAGMQYEFGKPQAPQETWEPFAREARVGLVREYAKGAACDVVAASLHLCVEDDAYESRTSVCLPREAYIKRMDKLVDEFIQRDLSYMSEEDKLDGDKVIAAVERYLFEEQQYRPPTGWREAFSPYRTYFHNVIAQKVGIPATLAAIYIGFLERLKAKGGLACGDVSVLLRVRRGADPTPRRPWGIKAGDVVPEGSVVCTSDMVVRQQLMALKRAFWPWEWDDSRDTGFLLAVESAAYGKDDRMNTAAGVVGIIQPTGRPFGDLKMATLVTERLAELDGGFGYEARDMGVLLYHGGYRADALRTLEAFQQWKATARLTSNVVEISAPSNAPQQRRAQQSPDFAWVAGDPILAARLALREDEALAKVLVELHRDALEHQFEHE